MTNGFFFISLALSIAQEIIIDRAGVASHFLAMSHSARRNFSKYDFLAGESQYKRSLADGQETLTGAVVLRKTMKSYLECVAIYLWNRITAKK